MCINCNLFLPVRPSVVTRLYLVDPPSTNDGGVLMSHRQMTVALKRRCATTDLSELFPEVRMGIAPSITVDAVEELDLESLFERDGLHAINFANADCHRWTLLEERDGYVLGTVVPKVGDPRVMPPGYPLTQLCYQSCAAMMRALARPGGAATMHDVLSGAKPSWLVAEDEAENMRAENMRAAGMHVGNKEVAETGDASGGKSKWMCAIM